MVRIINYSERIADDGRTFFTLEVQGGVEMIRSKSSNNFYATAKKASIPCTFDGETCQALIGTEIPGNVQKQECEPYEYTVRDTGEVIELRHRYVYVPADRNQAEANKQNQEFAQSVSPAGMLEPAM